MRDKIEVPAELFVQLFRLAPAYEEANAEGKQALDEARPYIDLAHKPRWYFEGRRWTQRSTGNTYHIVKIYENDELIWTSPEKYGYGDQFMTTAFRWLIKEGKVPPCELGCYGSLDLRETFGGSYRVYDCATRKEMLP